MGDQRDIDKLQTEEQKLLMDRAKKKVLDPNSGGARDAIIYLAKRRSGQQFLEKTIPDLRKEKDGLQHWKACLTAYAYYVMPEDFPDSMVAEVVFDMERLKQSNSVVFIMRELAQFGERASAAAPTIEWIRDNSPDGQAVKEAVDTLRKIKGK